MRLNPYHTFFKFTPWPVSGLTGSGTANEIAYWNTATSLAALATATYPSLTELSYVKGVTSALQTQIDGKQASDADLTSWAGVTRAAGFDTFVATPSSANLASLVTGETGSGALVFATSPQLTTSLTTDSTTFALLNATATTINFAGAATTLNIGASATCILNFGGSTTASEFRFLEPSGSGTNYSAFKAVAQSANITYSLPPTVGAAGTYLKDAAGDGVLTWATAGGTSTPTMKICTSFETITTRFDETNVGTGDSVFDTNGLKILTGATGTSSSQLRFGLAATATTGVFDGLPKFTCYLGLSIEGTTATSFFGIGQPTINGTDITFTDRHLGFKLVTVTSVTSVYATQADGTTETASAALTTIDAGSSLDLIADATSTSNVNYYWRLNGGTLSSATALTTNLPTANSENIAMTWCVTNQATASNTQYRISGSSYER